MLALGSASQVGSGEEGRKPGIVAQVLVQLRIGIRDDLAREEGWGRHRDGRRDHDGDGDGDGS